MKFGFQTDWFDVRTQNGRDDIALTNLEYLAGNGDLLRIPIGATSDGISDPPLIWWIPGFAFAGNNAWRGAFLHDAGYRNALERKTGVGTWVKSHYTKEQIDDLFLEAMTRDGVGFVRRHILYFAVRFFGQSSFDEDRETYS